MSCCPLSKIILVDYVWFATKTEHFATRINEILQKLQEKKKNQKPRKTLLKRQACMQDSN